MPAPAAPHAPAAVNKAPVEIKPSKPKAKIDSPRFDDALKQASAKPAKAEKAMKSTKSPKTAKTKGPKKHEAPVESSPVETDPTQSLPDNVQPAAEVDENEVGAVAVEVSPVPAEVAPIDAAASLALDPIPPAVAVDQPPFESRALAGDKVRTTPAAATVVDQTATAVQQPPPQVTKPVDPTEVAADTSNAEGEAPPVLLDSGQPEPAQKLTRTEQLAPDDRREEPSAVAPSKPAEKPKQFDQSPVPPVEHVAPQSTAADRETEQPTDDVEAEPVTNLVEPSILKQLKISAAPSSTSADLIGTAAVATKSTPEAAREPAPVAPTQPAPTPREVEFARANHDRIVTDIRAQLLPRGGTMQIRLDPPQLGALQVAVHMLDGVMNVSFQTSNDEATQALSHSLTQLKHVLESHGVSVDKLHVQQAPRGEQSSSNSNESDQPPDQRHGAHEETLARQEQQRKEMLRRMWRRLALGSDPLDLVA